MYLPSIAEHEIRRSDTGDEKIEYPFALVLRLRVVQVVCGISTLLMGAVALIEEKTPFNLGLGVPAGMSTVMAAGFDGYIPPDCKHTSPFWKQLRIFGASVKLGVINIFLWSFAAFVLLLMVVRAVVLLVASADNSVSLKVIAGTELAFTAIILSTVIGVTWVDAHYDPDSQEPPDLAHSNTGTAVSMVTLSQSAPV